MKVMLMSMWLLAIYGLSGVLLGDIARHMTIWHNAGDKSYAYGHLEWALAIYFTLVFLIAKPLFYYWRKLSGKYKVLVTFITSFIWPVALLLSCACLLLLQLKWQELSTILTKPVFWIWFLFTTDLFNTLGRWVDESEFWQQKISTWQSLGTIGSLYRRYPPESSADVTPGVTVGILIVLAGFVLYWVIHF